MPAALQQDKGSLFYCVEAMLEPVKHGPSVDQVFPALHCHQLSLCSHSGGWDIRAQMLKPPTKQTEDISTAHPPLLAPEQTHPSWWYQLSPDEANPEHPSNYSILLSTT